MTVCPECGEEKGTHVYDHLFSVHNYSRDDIEVLKMKKRKLKSAASVSGFECNHCGSMHLSRGALATHKSKQHRRKDESAEGSAVSTNTVHKERSPNQIMLESVLQECEPSTSEVRYASASPDVEATNAVSNSSATASNSMDNSDDDDQLHIDENEKEVSASLLANIFCSSDGTLHEPLRILWSRLRAVGCIIDAAQVKPTRRKLKCSVDRCVYKGGPIDSIQLKCTLPSNVELAMQWICVCVSDPFHQNTHILRLLDLLKADIDDTAPLPQTISPKKLVAFPFRVCSRHFSTEPPEDPPLPIAPMFHLPGRRPIPREDVIMKLRSRSVALSEAGYDDVEVDKLAPNCVLVSPSTGPLNCDVPGCRYKTCDVSPFSGRYINMYSVLSTTADYGEWRMALQAGLGIPSCFDFILPEGARLCEMHFTEGKRYARGMMKDPSIFRRLITRAINPALSRLGALRLSCCSVKSCVYHDIQTVCFPFPSLNDPYYSRWLVVLSEADTSFSVEKGTAICTRHFSIYEHDGLVPALHLGSEPRLDPSGTKLAIKRNTQQAGEENQPKRIRLSHDSSGSAIMGKILKDSLNNEFPGDGCCAETKNVLTALERMEIKSRALERLVMHLNSMCRCGFAPKDGSLERDVKFKLFELLSELRSERAVIHTLRERIDDGLTEEGERYL